MNKKMSGEESRLTGETSRLCARSSSLCGGILLACAPASPPAPAPVSALDPADPAAAVLGLKKLVNLPKPLSLEAAPIAVLLFTSVPPPPSTELSPIFTPLVKLKLLGNAKARDEAFAEPGFIDGCIGIEKDGDKRLRDI